MSILLHSSFVQSSTPYLKIPTAHAIIPVITFPPFNCSLSSFFTLLMYLLFTFSFISLFMMESNCDTLKCLYPSRLTSLICFPSGNSMASVWTIFPLLKTDTAQCSEPNTIPTSSEKILTVWIRESISLSLSAMSLNCPEIREHSISDFYLLNLQSLSHSELSIEI